MKEKYEEKEGGLNRNREEKKIKSRTNEARREKVRGKGKIEEEKRNNKIMI